VESRGTIIGLLWIPFCVYASMPWLLVLFPVMHAAPGLIGHRLFERNVHVGDLRINRKDYSPIWFIVANHRLAWDLLLAKVR
jgi:hypothetical protein